MNSTQLKLRCASAAIVLLAACTGTSREHAAKPSVVAARQCTPPPLASTLYLRGTMNTWTTQELDAFVYDCDAYTIDVDLTGPQEFRIGDEKLSGGLSFGAPRTAKAPLEVNQVFAMAQADSANLHFDFAGAYTLRVAVTHAGTQGAAQATLTIVPTDRAAAAKAAIGDPVARSLRFDSRDPVAKAPFGAVTAGSEVAYQLDALPGVDVATLVIERRRLEGSQEALDYREVARVPLARARAGAREAWRGRYRYAEIGVYGYYFLVEIGGNTYRYENNRDRIYFTREAGSNGLGEVSQVGATQRAPSHAIRHFRQTVYRADFKVPDWARDAVFYYIFPERFRNGDTRNDPKPGVDTYQNHAIEFHRNWLDKPYLPRSGDGSDNVYANDFFGGDIAGIIDKLDYIRDLGANTLYINPLFRAASNHKYDTADYTQIDPHFGTNAEFVRLCREAAKRGLRVIPDTSLNHTGSDSLYFDRYDKFPGIGAFKGEHIHADSPYADWYAFDPTQHDPSKQYRGWMGTPDLPEVNKSSPSFRAYAFGARDSVMKQWLDRGASGWRMDVAPWVPDDFWREWRTAVKGHKPDALTIAETFFDASKYFLGDEFDSTMNYIFLGTVQTFAKGGDARVAYQNIELMRENYPPQAFYALMNLIDSHDLPRALYQFGYRDEHSDAATIARAKQRLHLAVLFQMIFPGAPAVYYGDEAGMTGGEDPYNRGTYPWADRGGKPDPTLLADYRKLIHLRRDHPILRRGALDAPAYLDEHVIVLLRRDGKQWAVTALNNDAAVHRVSIAVPPSQHARLHDVLNGGTVEVANSSAAFDVPAMSGVVLINVSNNRVEQR